MQVSVKVDTSGVAALLQNHSRQIPFTVAKALTATAKDAADAVTRSIPVRFDRPTKFTQKAMTIIPATKASGKAVVLVKDQQAKYLQIEEEGGQRSPEPGSPIVTPVRYRTNMYGNIARGALARQRARPDTFVSNGKGKTRHLAPGLYLRPKVGVRRDGKRGTTGASKTGGRWAKGESGLTLLAAFHKKARYTARFGMRTTVEQTVKSAFQTRLQEAVEFAIRTAR